MKKLALVLVVLLAATTLFAAGTVKVGGAFEFITGRTRDFKFGEQTLSDTKKVYKSSGFGFDVSGR